MYSPPVPVSESTEPAQYMYSPPVRVSVRAAWISARDRTACTTEACPHSPSLRSANSTGRQTSRRLASRPAVWHHVRLSGITSGCLASRQAVWHHVRLSGITSGCLASRQAVWHHVRLSGITSGCLASRQSVWHHVRLSGITSGCLASRQAVWHHSMLCGVTSRCVLVTLRHPATRINLASTRGNESHTLKEYLSRTTHKQFCNIRQWKRWVVDDATSCDHLPGSAWWEKGCPSRRPSRGSWGVAGQRRTCHPPRGASHCWTPAHRRHRRGERSGRGNYNATHASATQWLLCDDNAISENDIFLSVRIKLLMMNNRLHNQGRRGGKLHTASQNTVCIRQRRRTYRSTMRLPGGEDGGGGEEDGGRALTGCRTRPRRRGSRSWGRRAPSPRGPCQSTWGGSPSPGQARHRSLPASSRWCRMLQGCDSLQTTLGPLAATECAMITASIAVTPLTLHSRTMSHRHIEWHLS